MKRRGSAAEICNARAFLHVMHAVLPWGGMRQADSFWFVRLHKCLRPTSALEILPAFDLPIFVNGVWKFGPLRFSLVQ